MAPTACRGGIAVGEKHRRRKMYSVYRAKDEMPLIVYASAEACARAMGISRASFDKALTRKRSGKFTAMKWEIYEDGLGGSEDEC